MSSPVTPQHPEHLDLGRRVLAHFGLDVELGRKTEEMLKEACSLALGRFERLTGRRDADVSKLRDQLLMTRELTRVLAGSSKLLFGRARDAMLEVNDNPERRAEKQVLLARAESELVPDASRPGAYFDPLAWDVDQLPHATPHDRVVRLVLFVDAMLEQELGVTDAGVSLEDAATVAADEAGTPCRGGGAEREDELRPRLPRLRPVRDHDQPQAHNRHRVR